MKRLSAPTCSAAGFTAAASTREIQINETAIVLGIEPSNTVDGWIPIPPDDPFQRVLSVEPAIPAKFSIRHDSQHGNQLLHFEVYGAAGDSVCFGLGLVVQRRAAVAVDPDLVSESSDLGSAVELFAAVRRLADPRSSSLEVAESVVGRARRRGIPARVVSGHNLAAQDFNGRASHSWAELYIRNHGWLPADVMCDCELGGLPIGHVARSRGSGILLEPAQQGARLRSLAGPYVEVDGTAREFTAELRARVDDHMHIRPRRTSVRAREDLSWLVTLTGHLPAVAVGPGRPLRDPGDGMPAALLLISGLLRIVRFTADGRRLELGVVRAPALMLGSRLRGNRVESAAHSAVRLLDNQILAEIAQRHPVEASNLMASMGAQFSDLEDRLESLAFGDVRSRVAGRLIELLGDGNVVAGITHEQIGDMVGAARETVTKILRTWQRSGLIRISPRRIDVLDVNGLRGVGRARADWRPALIHGGVGDGREQRVLGLS